MVVQCAKPHSHLHFVGSIRLNQNWGVISGSRPFNPISTPGKGSKATPTHSHLASRQSRGVTHSSVRRQPATPFQVCSKENAQSTPPRSSNWVDLSRTHQVPIWQQVGHHGTVGTRPLVHHFTAIVEEVGVQRRVHLRHQRTALCQRPTVGSRSKTNIPMVRSVVADNLEVGANMRVTSRPSVPPSVKGMEGTVENALFHRKHHTLKVKLVLDPNMTDFRSRAGPFCSSGLTKLMYPSVVNRRPKSHDPPRNEWPISDFNRERSAFINA